MGWGVWWAGFKPLKVHRSKSRAYLLREGNIDWCSPSSCRLRCPSHSWHPRQCHIHIHTWPVSITVAVFLVSTRMWPSPVTMRPGWEQLRVVQPSVVGRHHPGKKRLSFPAPELCEMLNHIIPSGLDPRDPGDDGSWPLRQDPAHLPRSPLQPRIHWHDPEWRMCHAEEEVNMVPWRPHKSTMRAFVCK